MQHVRVISDPVNQIRRYRALSELDFSKPQLNATTYMCCDLKESNQTAMIIEVFSEPWRHLGTL